MSILKKEIRVTRNLDECNRIRALLSKYDIETFVITNTITNPGRHHGIPFINISATYEYHIFVNRKEGKRALDVLHLL